MTKIPPLTSVSATLGDLQQRRAALLGQAHALRADTLALARSPNDDHPPGTVPAADVAELLGRTPPPRQASRVERLAEMGRRIATLEAAADVLAREIEGEINRASAIIRERLQPEVDRRLRAVALAVAAAQAANAELGTLLDEAEAGGVRGVPSMNPLHGDLLESARDPHGRANHWLRAAVGAGLLKERELPEGARL